MVKRLHTPEERFEARVVRGKARDECWGWSGQVLWHGYGTFWPWGRDAGKKYAHVYSWETLNGPVPQGCEIDHLCHTAACQPDDPNACPHRRCANPLHLDLVTHETNVRRMRGWRCDDAGVWWCSSGHEIVPERQNGNGCLLCQYERREHHVRKPDASKGGLHATIYAREAEERLAVLGEEHPLLVAEARRTGLLMVRSRLVGGWTYDERGWYSKRVGFVPFASEPSA